LRKDKKIDNNISYVGRPLFTPYFKIKSNDLPPMEELLDIPNRFYHNNNIEDNILQKSSEKNAAVDNNGTSDTSNYFSPKDVQIFDTSIFKSGLKLRESIGEKSAVHNDARKGLVSYCQYLHGAKSAPK
jgi:hypothetical protein